MQLWVFAVLIALLGEVQSDSDSEDKTKMMSEVEVEREMAKAGLTDCWHMIKREVFTGNFNMITSRSYERTMRRNAVKLMEGDSGPCEKIKPHVARYMRVPLDGRILMANEKY